MDECESRYIQSGKQRCSGKGEEFLDRAKIFCFGKQVRRVTSQETVASDRY